MTESKALITGLSGTELTAEEKSFFAEHRPWGFILFSRNLRDESQIKNLNAILRDTVNNPNAPIFIDQEGGRVQRLRPPLAPNYPSAAQFGKIYEQNQKHGLKAARLMARLLAIDLRKLDFTASCMPVLDVPIEGAHNVIGDRAYAKNPKCVNELGRASAQGLMEGGILPVIKHIPGHGRGGADSHHHLPVVHASLEELKTHDFIPFQALADLPMAMTGHLLFTALDKQNPATTSKKIIKDIIRDFIGFNGLLMSDDSSMNALSGDLAHRARSIISAGCDIVLHCNGVMSEMKNVAQNTPILKGKSLKRAEKALEQRDVMQLASDDEMVMREEFAQQMVGFA
jgi:beta-N-acetylhexosaminidase